MISRRGFTCDNAIVTCHARRSTEAIPTRSSQVKPLPIQRDMRLRDAFEVFDLVYLPE